jgi:hypothetical protein
MRFRIGIAALVIATTASALASPSVALADDHDSVTISSTGAPTITVGLPGNSNGSANTIVPGTGTTQMLTTIADASAPTRYAYQVDIPGGGSVELFHDGATVQDGDDTIAIIQAPWAHDADGKNVPTHFETNGDSLTQVVDHTTGSYRYPITADPFWSTAWKVTVCAAAISGVIAGGALGAGYIASLGGPVMAAQLLIVAGSATERAKAIFGSSAWIMSVRSVQDYCF